MRKQTVLRLGASALLVGLALVAFVAIRGPALASGKSAPPPGQTGKQYYCEVYVNALASQLKASVPELGKVSTAQLKAQLAAANESALEATIRQAYTDGSINQAQETNLLNKVKQTFPTGSDPCVDMARAAAAHRAQYASAHQAVLTAVAGALNLSPATLQSDLSSGQTVAQIAAAQHANLAEVNAAYLAAVQSQLNAAVKNGTMTQTASEQLYMKIQRAVANGSYPLLNARGWS